MKIIFLGNSITQGTIGASYYKLLSKKLRKDQLINYGKNGDTVQSLYNRIKREKLDLKSDMIFLWIGTNDIFVKVNWTFTIAKTFFFQPWISDNKEFKSYYKKILDLIYKKTDKIFTVSPLFIGEDFKNKWHSKLDEFSKIIMTLSKNNKKIDYIDLRKVFMKKLKSKIVSKYIVSSNTGIFLDYMKNKNENDVNKTADIRGLHYTLDGIHLNSKGAGVVAEIFLKKIKERRN